MTVPTSIIFTGCLQIFDAYRAFNAHILLKTHVTFNVQRITIHQGRNAVAESFVQPVGFTVIFRVQFDLYH